MRRVQSSSREYNRFLILVEQCRRKELYKSAKLSHAGFARNYAQEEAVSEEKNMRVRRTNMKILEFGIFSPPPIQFLPNVD
jgi:hypothetical protein